MTQITTLEWLRTCLKHTFYVLLNPSHCLKENIRIDIFSIQFTIHVYCRNRGPWKQGSSKYKHMSTNKIKMNCSLCPLEQIPLCGFGLDCLVSSHDLHCRGDINFGVKWKIDHKHIYHKAWYSYCVWYLQSIQSVLKDQNSNQIFLWLAFLYDAQFSHNYLLIFFWKMRQSLSFTTTLQFMIQVSRIDLFLFRLGPGKLIHDEHSPGKSIHIFCVVLELLADTFLELLLCAHGMIPDPTMHTVVQVQHHHPLHHHLQQVGNGNIIAIQRRVKLETFVGHPQRLVNNALRLILWNTEVNPGDRVLWDPRPWSVAR